MYKKILVAVAFHGTDQARNAIDIADHLREDGGTIRLLHVVEEIPSYIANQLPEGLIEKSRDDAKAQLHELAEGVIPDVTTAVVYGHSGHTIVDYANTHGFDCIVISSHRPELSDFFLGSTASRVVRHANCAVHIAR